MLHVAAGCSLAAAFRSVSLPTKRTPAKRRHDFDDAPIDGDYRLDQILNKDPAKHYMLANDDDAERWIFRGAKFTERREDGPRSPYDINTEDGSRIRVHGLWLMEIPIELRNRIVAAEQSRAEEATKLLDRKSSMSGGTVSRETRTS